MNKVGMVPVTGTRYLITVHGQKENFTQYRTVKYQYVPQMSAFIYEILAKNSTSCSVWTSLQKNLLSNISDPYCFLCGSRSSFLPQCGSRSGSREPNQCGSTRIRILVRLCCHKNVGFLHEIYGTLQLLSHKTYLRRYPGTKTLISFSC
jgi:hypothetical protein